MAEKNGSPFVNVALEFVRVTEVGAIAAARWIGRGDGKAADQAAVDAMREYFNMIDFRGEIVIGEGAKDEAAELYIGEKLGKGTGPSFDIAIDPLECTDSVAYGRSNALSVIATGPEDSLYRAADSYMEKIAVGPDAMSVIDIDSTPSENVRKVAAALGKDVPEVTVAILERPRHDDLIAEVRATGARVQLFTDGDIAMAIATCKGSSAVDILMGVGGSAEAVISAAALRCLGGEIICRWKPKDEKHVERLRKAGITDFSTVFRSHDLARGKDLSFTATGVMTGPLVKGVTVGASYTNTHSVVMTSNPRTIRYIDTRHITM
ncbi:fructose-bisphosphatase, class II [Candidatus Kaiserbacteria bacterium RIFCSPHIGHO2_01_FULL_55_17]|uniref:Fructose-1,6-bisphosphatase n=1 Tax=Candidatus Kaiserbacteria bacterium RIFCSPHIGHO2_01_FULL_55_17 TaxID=1798484 RepID=A0A1F6D7Q0_9BACT|nr:MAG: fructose-bisphosphatase, class II [Candidatus Kaiserbacteria bacterium RIFCSPHIGHO2_01_FULL_55_17]